MDVFLALVIMYAAYRYMTNNEKRVGRRLVPKQQKVAPTNKESTLPDMTEYAYEKIPKHMHQNMNKIKASERSSLNTTTLKEKPKRAPRPRKAVAQTRLKPKTSNLKKSRYADRSVAKSGLKVEELGNAMSGTQVFAHTSIQEGVIWQQVLNAPVAHRNRRC